MMDLIVCFKACHPQHPIAAFGNRSEPPLDSRPVRVGLRPFRINGNANHPLRIDPAFADRVLGVAGEYDLLHRTRKPLPSASPSSTQYSALPE